MTEEPLGLSVLTSHSDYRKGERAGLPDKSHPADGGPEHQPEPAGYSAAQCSPTATGILKALVADATRAAICPGRF